MTVYATIVPSTIQPTRQPTAPSLHVVGNNRQESVKIEKIKKGVAGWKARDLPKHDIWQIFSE